MARRVRGRPHLVIPAVHIEALSERYALLTLIVTGESLLSILFEAFSVLTADSGRVSVVRLYVSSAFGLIIAYSFYTWNFCTDNAPPLPHGRHAIRFHRSTAIFWTHLHLLYHAAILFTATGVGLAVRSAALVFPPAQRHLRWGCPLPLCARGEALPRRRLALLPAGRLPSPGLRLSFCRR